jgi:hypothetical protein
MSNGNTKSRQDARYLAAARQYGATIERLARRPVPGCVCARFFAIWWFN